MVYAYYGGRGIRVCKRWHDFKKFLEDMGHKPSLKYSVERKENKGNYEPSNYVWATQKEQCNNTRRNRRETYKGETKTVAEWAEFYGLKYTTLWYRLTHNWSIGKALTTSVH